ncbi:hypothetical protein M747DRAFT_146896 [Aspergillus niger ATCC 13496]|uniref:Uncharacterized protein n=1 Tax=Aspergillus niger ATCC 13496 TaxID=1353008 RepID=A0A370BNZ0_ASPNG|nr:hypothetical protein M747DRAFT_146896 [Aspergillus niger ATCC 13496]
MTFHLYCCGAVLIGESKIPITVSSMLPYICIYVCMYFFFLLLQLASSILATLSAYAEYTCLEKEAISKVQGLCGVS